MRSIFVFLLGFAAATPAQALLLGNAEQGEELHAQYCQSCHANRYGGDGSAIYTRPDRRINSIEGLMKQVNFCDQQIGTELSDDQINDLVRYLNDSYYRFATD